MRLILTSNGVIKTKSPSGEYSYLRPSKDGHIWLLNLTTVVNDDLLNETAEVSDKNVSNGLRRAFRKAREHNSNQIVLDLKKVLTLKQIEDVLINCFGNDFEVTPLSESAPFPIDCD